MKTLNWTSSTGKALEAQIEYSAAYYAPQPIDGGWEGHSPESYAEIITITILVDGKVLGTSKRLPVQYDSRYDKDMPAECAVIIMLTTPDGRSVRVGTNGITVDAFKRAIADLRAANAPADVLRMIDAETAARCKKDRDNAEAILACKYVFDDDKALASWRRSYNALHNEGGEGYIPMTVTVAQQAWAREILGAADQSVDTRDIIEANLPVIDEFFAGIASGDYYNGTCWQLYLDRDDNTMTIHQDIDDRHWLQRDDGSLVLVLSILSNDKRPDNERYNAANGDSLDDYGYSDWIDYTLDPALSEALRDI